MNLFEMEVALLDGFTLTYIDFNDFSRCYITYEGADTVKLVRETTYEETEEYTNMSSLLVSLDEDETVYVEVFSYQ